MGMTQTNHEKNEQGEKGRAFNVLLFLYPVSGLSKYSSKSDTKLM